MQQLRFVSMSLKAAELKTYLPKITMESRMYFSKWGQSGQLNLLEALSELTILTASRCLMGKEIRECLFDKVAKLYADMDSGITPLAVFYPTAPLRAHRIRDAARAEMGRLFSDVITKRRQTGERVRGRVGREGCGDKGGKVTNQCFFPPTVVAARRCACDVCVWLCVCAVQHEDCLQAFMDCEYKDGTKLTDDSVRALGHLFVFAVGCVGLAHARVSFTVVVAPCAWLLRTDHWSHGCPAVRGPAHV